MTTLLVLLVLAAIGVYLLFAHNLVAFIGFALVVSLVPFARTPVDAIPLALVACAGLWAALATRVRTWPKPGVIEGLSLALVVAAGFSAVGHGFGDSGFSDFVRWVAAIAVVYPLRALTAAELTTVVRVFVAGCVGATVMGLRSTDRTVETSAGEAGRLVGPFVDPNVAGMVITVGLVLAVAFLRGPLRVAASLVLMLGVTLTLSRSALGSVAVAVVLVVLVGRVSMRTRIAVTSLGAVGAAGLLAVPSTRARLLDSFGAYDIGSAARWEALRNLPSDLAGQWWLGLGFGAPEFTDPTVSATTNFAANAVLHAALRGGVVVGLVFLALLVAAGVIAWRRLRTGTPEGVVVGAGVLGLLLVALQLDVPVVTVPPVTAVFSLLLAVVAHPTLYERGKVAR